MTVRTHVAHDLDAIPTMHHSVEVGGVGRGEGACHGLPLLGLVWVANATLALAESGVCKRQAPSQGPEKQQNCDAGSASGFVAFWVEGA